MVIAKNINLNSLDRKFLNDSMKEPMLSRDEEKRLAEAWVFKNDKKAMHKIIRAYSKLVIAFSMKFKNYGLPVNDLVQGTNLPNSGLTTVTAINTGAKMITFTGTSAAGIGTGTQFTVTHATDTNTDRGLSFKYNVGVGTANTNEGFFGLDDSSIASSTVGTGNHGTHGDNSRRWTYVPDATITGSVVAGTKGFLDVKGIYYQSGNFSSGGVVWFDSEAYNSPQMLLHLRLILRLRFLLQLQK